MAKTLDEIMSGEGTDVSGTEQTQDTIDDQQPQGEGDQGAPNEGQNAQEGEPPKTVPLAALEDEKAKRRNYKEQLEKERLERARIEGVLQALQAQHQAPKAQAQQTPAPSFFEDPDAAISQVLSAAEQRMQARFLDASFADAHEQHKEQFEEAYQALIQATQAGDRQLRDQIVSSPNPGRALMRWHQHRKALAEIGNDPVAYKAKLEAELLAKLQAQQSQQPAHSPGHQPRPTTMPSSFTQAQNAGVRTAPQWSGPKPISEIMNR